LVAFAAAVAFVLIAPWSNGSSFSEKALAAVGAERYVRALVQPALPQSAVVDLTTGSERPVTEKTLYVYDSQSGEYLTWSYVGDVLVGSGDVLPGTGMPEPGLAAFLGGYRKALADGSAKIVGETSFRGHKAKILRFDASECGCLQAASAGLHAPFSAIIDIPGETEDVAIDSSSYQPLWYRFNSTLPHGKHEQWPIYRFDSITSVAHPGPAPKSTPALLGQIIPLRTVSPATATQSLRHLALWAGATVKGISLRSVHLDRVTTSVSPYITPSIRSGLGLDLIYQSANQRFEIEEAPTPQSGYGFNSSRLGPRGPITPRGTMTLGCNDSCFATNQPTQYRGTWVGQLHQDGLYINVSSENRELVIAAARSLTPTP
jgi:hypothetical protein